MLAAASLNLNAVVVSFIIGSLLPFIHDTLVKLHASDKVKSAVAIFLSAVGSFLQSAIRPDGSAVISTATLSSFFIILITSRVTYKQYEALGVQGKIVPTKGLG